MSFATLKRQTRYNYRVNSVGRNGFSLVGKHRNIGWIGQPAHDNFDVYALSETTNTPFRQTESYNTVLKRKMVHFYRGNPYSWVRPSISTTWTQKEYVDYLEKKEYNTIHSEECEAIAFKGDTELCNRNIDTPNKDVRAYYRDYLFRITAPAINNSVLYEHRPNCTPDIM